MIGRFRRQLARLPQAEAGVEQPREGMQALRVALARALSSSSLCRAPVRREPVAFADALPFERINTLAGPLWRRQIAHAPDERVGRMPLGSLARVDRAVLAALSLSPQIASVDLEALLCIDLETTGLGGGTGTYAFLVGMSRRTCKGWLMEQILLSDPDEEPAMLAYVRERIAACELLVSFNGKAFDMTLLRARYRMWKQPLPPERVHLDLLHVARRVHALQSFPKTLATLEREVLCFARGPDVSGEEVAARYLQYLRTGDARLLEEPHRHNARDVMSLVALLAMYGEPFSRLCPDELAAAARVARRAGDLDLGLALADAAVERGAVLAGSLSRAEIHRARGDVALAALDYEAVLRLDDDAEARLRLAKLYEHRLGAPARALAIAALGTGEGEAAEGRRLERLRHKEEKARARALDSAHAAIAPDPLNSRGSGLPTRGSVLASPERLG